VHRARPVPKLLRQAQSLGRLLVEADHEHVRRRARESREESAPSRRVSRLRGSRCS
jgi:hypothetical protein